MLKNIGYTQNMSSALASGPDVLGLLITSKCNIICRHCCNDSHPRNSKAVPFEDIAKIIEMAAEIPSIKEIGISGGEPFLFIHLLNRVIQFATSKGLTSSVTTNGFWAKSMDRAIPLLAELKASGLRAICVSTSIFHQEFIDLNTVVNAAHSALQEGLNVTINFVSTSSYSVDDLRGGLGEISDKVDIIVMPCLATGRGAGSVQKNELPREFGGTHGNCSKHFKKLAVDASGNVYPCCSPGGFTNPLLMGNVRDMSLHSIMEMSQHNKLLAILKSVGPEFFLPFLRASTPKLDLPETFSDQCHLCNTILSSDKYAFIVKNASEQLFLELSSNGEKETLRYCQLDDVAEIK